jgi:predicted small integral membrane protein
VLTTILTGLVCWAAAIVVVAGMWASWRSRQWHAHTADALRLVNRRGPIGPDDDPDFLASLR